MTGTSLVVQWLKLHSHNAGDLGLIPGQGTRSHMPQLKILHATTKTQHSQINKYFLMNFKGDDSVCQVLYMVPATIRGQ